MNPRELPPVLLSEERIRTRVGELAERISKDYAGADELLLVGVLRGAFIFLADLSRRLTVPRRVDFIASSTYGLTTEAKQVELVMDLRTDVGGRHVLVVDDILDSGYTLDFVMRTLAARGPASLKSCVFVRKRGAQRVDVDVDYLGFEIPDAWVVGYGLDYAEQHRTLPYIGVVAVDAGAGAGGRGSGAGAVCSGAEAAPHPPRRSRSARKETP